MYLFNNDVLVCVTYSIMQTIIDVEEAAARSDQKISRQLPQAFACLRQRNSLHLSPPTH